MQTKDQIQNAIQMRTREEINDMLIWSKGCLDYLQKRLKTDIVVCARHPILYNDDERKTIEKAIATRQRDIELLEWILYI